MTIGSRIAENTATRRGTCRYRSCTEPLLEPLIGVGVVIGALGTLTLELSIGSQGGQLVNVVVHSWGGRILPLAKSGENTLLNV